MREQEEIEAKRDELIELLEEGKDFTRNHHLREALEWVLEESDDL